MSGSLIGDVTRAEEQFPRKKSSQGYPHPRLFLRGPRDRRVRSRVALEANALVFGRRANIRTDDRTAPANYQQKGVTHAKKYHSVQSKHKSDKAVSK